jgi:hypothetical protein
MRIARNALFALLLAGGIAGAARAQAVSAGIHVGPSGRASVDAGFFYDDLAPYGNWVQRPSYGWVWTPRAVAASWQPYENGHWAWTDDGWVWVSSEPYGWATYHYGRWYDDPDVGWSWVPGDTWGPSWVSWQVGGDYVGWAPLPPGVSVGVGFTGGGYAFGIAPAAYLFVPERNFLSPRLGGYYVPRDRVGAIYAQTRNFGRGVPVANLQRYGRVPQYRVADLAAGSRRNGARIEGNRLALFRPQVQNNGRVLPPSERAGARRSVISAAQLRAAHGSRVRNQVAVARRESPPRENRPSRAVATSSRQPVRVAERQHTTAVRTQQARAAQAQQRQRVSRERQVQVAQQRQQRQRATVQHERVAQASRQRESAVRQRQAQVVHQQRQQRQAQVHPQQRAQARPAQQARERDPRRPPQP